MNVARNAGEVLAEHTTLELECIDRMYLNVYVPMLQSGAGTAYFFRKVRGNPVPSSALMEPMTRRDARWSPRPGGSRRRVRRRLSSRTCSARSTTTRTGRLGKARQWVIDDELDRMDWSTLAGRSYRDAWNHLVANVSL